MTARSYGIVSDFEARVSEFCGSRFAVAVESCTSALFLSLTYVKEQHVHGGRIDIPRKTYISVPMAALHAGFDVRFVDMAWTGEYPLLPTTVIDAAKRFRKGMFNGGFQCLSFHLKKNIPIGRGGMILLDDKPAYEALKKMRYDGRSGKPYDQEVVESLGWNMYMTPDQAARGMMLMDTMPSADGFADQTEDYPDLLIHPVFNNSTRVSVQQKEAA